jgi:hypothetical protein
VLSNVDPNFGITADIILQNVNTTTGAVDNTVNVTSIAAAAGIDLTTSFSSKIRTGHQHLARRHIADLHGL